MKKASITDVVVTNGLYHAKVYWNVHNAKDEAQRQMVMKDIQKIAPMCRGVVASEVNVRYSYVCTYVCLCVYVYIRIYWNVHNAKDEAQRQMVIKDIQKIAPV
jgi:hypothetical protein